MTCRNLVYPKKYRSKAIPSRQPHAADHREEQAGAPNAVTSVVLVRRDASVAARTSRIVVTV